MEETDTVALNGEDTAGSREEVMQQGSSFTNMYMQLYLLN